MFNHYLKIFLRNILKHKGYTLINIAGLATGMAFAVLILLWVQFEMSFDRFHEHTDRLNLVAFTTEDRSFHGDATPGALAGYLESEFPEIVHATRVTSPQKWMLKKDDEKFVSRGRYVDPSFFEMFSFPFIEGDPKTAFSAPLSIVITRDLAQRIFGDKNAVGEWIQVSKKVSLNVTGVMDKLPENTDFQFDFLVPCVIGPSHFNLWDVKSLKTFVMLTEGSDYLAVGEKIKDVYNNHNNHINDLYLQPLKDVHLYDLYGGGRHTYVFIFSLLAASILLIACINFMNLATARSQIRYKEIGLKKIFGARRTQLAVQSLCESVLMSLIALVLAVALAELFLPAMNDLLGANLQFVYGGDLLLYLFGIALLTGLVAGSYPAVFLSSFQPVEILSKQKKAFRFKRWWKKDHSFSRTAGLTLRKFLVVAQFTLSIMLIIGVLVIYKQLGYIREMDMGFEKDQVVLFDMPREIMGKTLTIKNELLKKSNIEAVTVSNNSMVEWWSSFGVDWEGKQTDQTFDMGYNAVDYDYLETFQLELVEGRFFSREFPSDSSEACVINQAAVKAMGMKDPLGRRVTIAPHSSWEKHVRIIGVVKDFNTESAYKEIRPFMMCLQNYGSFMCLRLKPENMSGTIASIKQTINQIVPDVNIDIRFFDSEIANLYIQERMTGKVVVYITSLAVLISCLGLFGLAAFTAQQRTREIGIRKVLGSSVAGIMSLLTQEFLVLVIVANIIAWPIAYYLMNRWLENFAFRIDINWAIFVTTGSLALIIAVLTVCVQAGRAALTNPVDALRHE